MDKNEIQKKLQDVIKRRSKLAGDIADLEARIADGLKKIPAEVMDAGESKTAREVSELKARVSTSRDVLTLLDSEIAGYKTSLGDIAIAEEAGRANAVYQELIAKGREINQIIGERGLKGKLDQMFEQACTLEKYANSSVFTQERSMMIRALGAEWKDLTAALLRAYRFFGRLETGADMVQHVDSGYVPGFGKTP